MVALNRVSRAIRNLRIPRHLLLKRPTGAVAKGFDGADMGSTSRWLAGVLCASLLFGSAARAQSERSLAQQTLNLHVAQLQANPGDHSLRERIIEFVRTMNPAPPIPEQARQALIEGNTLVKGAKDQRGYNLAIDAYRQCLLQAPWWDEALYQSAAALELGGRFEDAAAALRLYLATGPNEKAARDAQDRIYELGAKQKLAAIDKGAVRPAVGAGADDRFSTLLRSIEGRRFSAVLRTTAAGSIVWTADIRNGRIVQGSVTTQKPPAVAPQPTDPLTALLNSLFGQPGGSGDAPATPTYSEDPDFTPVQISALELSRTVTNPAWTAREAISIGEDGTSITVVRDFSNGSKTEATLRWQETAAALSSPTAAPSAPTAAAPVAGVFTGSVAAVRPLKGAFTFEYNLRLEVVGDDGVTRIFILRKNSVVVSLDGTKSVFMDREKRFPGKRVRIEYAAIADATGGIPGGNAFAFLIGQTGIVSLQLLN